MAALRRPAAVVACIAAGMRILAKYPWKRWKSLGCGWKIAKPIFRRSDTVTARGREGSWTLTRVAAHLTSHPTRPHTLSPLRRTPSRPRRRVIRVRSPPTPQLAVHYAQDARNAPAGRGACQGRPPASPACACTRDRNLLRSPRARGRPTPAARKLHRDDGEKKSPYRSIN